MSSVTLKGSEVKLLGTFLQKGDKAPEISDEPNYDAALAVPA